MRRVLSAGVFLDRINFILPLIVKLLFEGIYVFKYSPYWSYIGATFTPNYLKALLSWIIAVLFLSFAGLCTKGKLSTLFGIFVNISVVSSLSIYWLKDESSIAFGQIVLYWLIYFLCTYVLSMKEASWGNGRGGEELGHFIPAGGNPLLFVLYLWVVATTLYFSICYGDGRLFIPLEDVYTYRLSGLRLGRFEGYIFAWNTNAFIPLFLAFHLLHSKKLLVCSDVLLMMLSYGVFGNKSMLMCVPLVFAVFVIGKVGMLKYLANIIGIIVVVYLCMSFFIPSKMFVALGDRIINGPTAGHYNYYDFFSSAEHPFLYLRESVLRFFARSPYEYPVSEIIGSSADYYSGQYNNMTNGLFSIAYANFGLAGVFIQPILIVGSYFVFIRLLREYNDVVVYTLLSVHALYFLSASFFSWLLTGGGVLVVFVLLLSKRFDCQYLLKIKCCK